MNKEDEKRIKETELFLLDMDGTLYLGNQLFPFTKDFLRTIRESGRKYMYLTNNSSKSVKAYVEKLGQLGIQAGEEEFFTSSQATAYYLKQHYSDAVLYVGGTQSLKEELRQEGFDVRDHIQKPEEIDVLVTGFDTELNFQKLEEMSKLLLLTDIPYIATNPDLVCPTEFGSVPDCGSVAIMLKNVSGKMPFVIGKPSPMMPLLAMEKAGVTPEHTAVIGDRIYTDVKSGLNAGALGILVMSGETTPQILAESADKPDLVLENVGEITKVLTN